MLRRSALMTLAAALALAACVTTPREPEPPPLTLDAQGLQPTSSALRVDFGRAQAGVVATVTRLLGEGPSDVVNNPECGAGPVTAISWENGLTLNFQGGTFAGWVNSDPELPVAGGFSAGQARLAMPQVSFQVTTLGTEFARSEIYGLLTPDDAEIAVLWAGVTCFFR